MRTAVAKRRILARHAIGPQRGQALVVALVVLALVTALLGGEAAMLVGTVQRLPLRV